MLVVLEMGCSVVITMLMLYMFFVELMSVSSLEVYQLMSVDFDVFILKLIHVDKLLSVLLVYY